jgi:pimeloyl-ACP methyl ester carboxylesterase
MTPGEMDEGIARLEGQASLHRVAWLGRSVAWRRFGDGPPLVLVHGGHGSWLHWIRNIEALAQRHTLWVPDLPGFGDSEPLGLAPHAPDRMRYLVDALEGSLDSLVGRGTPVGLAGFSFGGLVATQLAAQRGAVDRMALLGTAGHGGARRERAEMKNWRLPERDAMLAALRHNLLALMLHEEASADALALSVHEHCCARTRFRSRALSREGSLQTDLGRCRHPLLLIWGEHDVTAIPQAVAQQLATGGPGRDWCVVPGAGHWVQYERARDVNLLLLSWFGSAPSYPEI